MDDETDCRFEYRVLDVMPTSAVDGNIDSGVVVIGTLLG